MNQLSKAELLKESDMDKLKEYEIFCEARAKQNYYKGEILPFINKVCRKDMTSGDIDGFVWDYKKKILIVIEQKWTQERQKQSQDMFLQFIITALEEAKKQPRLMDWFFYMFKIVGDPPFHSATVENIYTREIKNVTRTQLIDILEMNIRFEDV